MSGLSPAIRFTSHVTLASEIMFLQSLAENLVHNKSSTATKINVNFITSCVILSLDCDEDITDCGGGGGCGCTPCAGKITNKDQPYEVIRGDLILLIGQTRKPTLSRVRRPAPSHVARRAELRLRPELIARPVLFPPHCMAPGCEHFLKASKFLRSNRTQARRDWLFPCLHSSVLGITGPRGIVPGLWHTRMWLLCQEDRLAPMETKVSFRGVAAAFPPPPHPRGACRLPLAPAQQTPEMPGMRVPGRLNSLPTRVNIRMCYVSEVQFLLQTAKADTTGTQKSQTEV